MKRFNRKLKSNKGASMIEYCLLLSLLAVAGLPGIYYLQNSLHYGSLAHPALILYLGGGSKGS